MRLIQVRYRVRRVLIGGAEKAPFDLARDIELWARFKRLQFGRDSMPLRFVYNDARDDEIARSVPLIGIGRRLALVYEAKVHAP